MVRFMLKTLFTRKLDSLGRLMIPSKLRDQLHMVAGRNYEFFVEKINDKTFLCIECPDAGNMADLGYKEIKRE